MKAYDFEYDGQYLSDYGFVICDFDSKGDGTFSNGSHITFNTVSLHNGGENLLTSAEYDERITSTFSICKYSCSEDAEEITVEEIRKIMRWLNRKEYHKFKLSDVEYSDIFFKASFNVSKIEFGGRVYGLELELFTNSSFAYHRPISISIENSSNNWTKTITSLSDEEGYIYPEMEITINGNGTFELYNELENRTMSIDGCTAGEIIKVNYPMIESNIPSHKIQNDFNWQFFRIANSYKNKENKLNISLPCTIKMTYTPIIKVGI